VRKELREAERIIASLGLRVIDSGRGKHHFWILETPSGKRFKQPIPHNTSEGCFWHNWKAQLRKHLSDDCTVNPRRTEQSGRNAGSQRVGTDVDARQRKGARA
jgi:hypothetical protein